MFKLILIQSHGMVTSEGTRSHLLAKYNTFEPDPDGDIAVFLYDETGFLVRFKIFKER